MTLPNIVIGTLTAKSSIVELLAEPNYEWWPENVRDVVTCAYGRAFETKHCKYVKDVIDPCHGSYNRNSRLHVLKEEVTLRNYDQSVVESYYMND